MAKKIAQFTGKQLHVRNVTFTEADQAANFRFEPSVQMDSFIAELIGPSGRNMDYAIKNLTVNGNTADAFKLIWDYLDDVYNVVGYNNTETNEAFIRLGVEYAQYLAKGGVPLTDVVVKYAPDDATDTNDTPERLQSLHDNLLGNFYAPAFNDRFTGATRQQLVDYLEAEGLSHLLTRPYYSGTDTPTPTDNPAATIAWDVQNGFLGAYQAGDRGNSGRGHDKNGDGIDDHQNQTGQGHQDRHDAADDRLHARNFTREIGDLDDSSTKNGAGTEMEVGAGIPDTNFNLFINHDEHIELGLKLHLRSGPDIEEESVGPDGTAYYEAPAGSVPSGTGVRALWNFDFSVNTGIEGSTNTLDDYDFRIVIVSGDGERAVFDLRHFGPGVTPWLTDSGVGFTDDDGLNPQLSQNSVNFGFAFMQAIFGADFNDAGETYDVYLQAFENNQLIGQVHDHILIG